MRNECWIFFGFRDDFANTFNSRVNSEDLCMLI